MNDKLIELAERVERATGLDNALDVLVDVALFVPDDEFKSIRANAAGTKVIYIRHDGGKCTFWADEWTGDRAGTAAALRSIAGREDLG